jgi:hypothetical protein
MSSHNKHFRVHQNDYARAHKTHGDQHASHIVSVLEHRYLPTSFDHPSNYRMQQARTNLSTHRMIDNDLLFGVPASGRAQYIAPQTYVERITRKINHFKTNGEINNPGVYDYLRENAERFDMDMRIFNGVEPRQNDMTHYRGYGRPRQSDYTAGGNLRRK